MTHRLNEPHVFVCNPLQFYESIKATGDFAPPGTMSYIPGWEPLGYSGWYIPAPTAPPMCLLI